MRCQLERSESSSTHINVDLVVTFTRRRPFHRCLLTLELLTAAATVRGDMTGMHYPNPYPISDLRSDHK